MKKKLIEVAFPLDVINAACIREKSIRKGHPSTLHVWWARRPLAACRAVLFAQLVDDPSSHPDQFCTEDSVEAERRRLFDIIEELVKWENSTDEAVLKRAQEEIRRSCEGELPSIYDPFSGGGTIPLEAQRLGLQAYGSDLNPVAVVIGKAMIEIPSLFKGRKPANPGPRERGHYFNADGLAEDVRYYSDLVKDKAFKQIGDLYPLVDLPKERGGGKSTAIAWIWARTVPSPDPAFSGVDVPIVSSFLLSSKLGRERWIHPIVDKFALTIQYSIREGGTKEEIKQASKGTKVGRGANFRCLFSGTAITPDYVRTAGKSGRMGQTLIATVAEGKGGRVYIPPCGAHEHIARSSTPNDKPDSEMNKETKNLQGYGLQFWYQLFTDRQLVALGTFSKLVNEVRPVIVQHALEAGFPDDKTPLRDGGTGAQAYSEAVSVYLALGISRLAARHSMTCSWDASRESTRGTFSRQAIPMVWDYAEANPFSGSTANWSAMCYSISKVVASMMLNSQGSLQQKDAQTVMYPNNIVLSTDPPYYNNIAYADLSDFFFYWLKLALKPVYPELFSILATPKNEELIATPHRHKNKKDAEQFFLQGMSKAISNMTGQSSKDYPVTIYYAFKSREIEAEGISSPGWATFLQAVVDAGYTVVRTWPIRTELKNRMLAYGTNSLANSVVLVCRKRAQNSEILSRGEYIRELKRVIPAAIETLQKINIAPADMPQSAIGPGIAVFSRCKAVLEAADTPMSVKTALQLINRELDEYLIGIQGEFDQETRFAITWFEQYGFSEGEFGVANSIATARGISVESVRQAEIVEAAGGKVRIISRDEIGPDPPTQRKHSTVWYSSQQLVRELDLNGESGAATLLKQLTPEHANAIRDLAYCLYDVSANKRKDAEEATIWNGLIAVWPDIVSLTDSIDAPTPQQTEIF